MNEMCSSCIHHLSPSMCNHCALNYKNEYTSDLTDKQMARMLAEINTNYMSITEKQIIFRIREVLNARSKYTESTERG